MFKLFRYCRTLPLGSESFSLVPALHKDLVPSSS